MRTESTRFFSDGLRLSAGFFLPDSAPEKPEAPQSLVIPCSGFTGLMNIHPARFARSLTAAGRWCFAFDYRGFAESEGERGRVILEEQVRDIVNAATFAASDPRIDERRIVLLGWGMGAGLVLEAARLLPGIVGIVAANGFYDGRRVQRAHRGEDGLASFLDEVWKKRVERVRTGEDPRVDPFHLYPLDPASREYVNSTLRTFEHYDAEGYSYVLADSLLTWRPEAHAPGMSTPLLIAHGDENALHPVEEAKSLEAAYGGAKELFWIEGAGHTEFMHDDDPKFLALAGRIEAWLSKLFE